MRKRTALSAARRRCPPVPSRPLRSLALALLVLLGQSATAWAVAPPGSWDPADRRLNRELAELVTEPGGPPGAIAVLRDGDRIRSYRAGLADLANPGAGAPRADDHARLASVSKMFNGAVALALVDRGALSLDDTIARWLPDLPAAWGAVTLRQLLNHTSGLPEYNRAPAFLQELQGDPHHEFDPHCLLGYVADQPLGFTPGSTYRYVNSDNIAAALMTEAATGRSYEDLLHDLVLDPLALRHTSLPRGFELPEPYLHGYAVAPPAAPQDVSTEYGMSGLWAAGGMVATPRDLSSFTRAYASGTLLSAATRAQQLTFRPGRSQPSGPGDNEVGLAIFRYTTRCGVVYGHTGNFLGYTLLAVGTPDGRRSLAFVVSEQLNDAGQPELVKQLREVQEDFVCHLLHTN
ncbi:serine hydrolase domain-containing protein [Kitasatospora sp. LaBMicrA B282]|uniref:serine hydrolase domain-containing protein n=1 Tax=Kitasatospora sp. LaBMicrA B282 TaxID=3420949 RepID=UPI003D0F64B9